MQCDLVAIKYLLMQKVAILCLFGVIVCRVIEMSARLFSFGMKESLYSVWRSNRRR